jgi:hypothetical protein
VQNLPLLLAVLLACPSLVHGQSPVLQQVTKLTPSGLTDPPAGDELGVSVAVDGERAVAGAPGQDVAGLNRAGAARVYLQGPGGWAEEALLVASDPESDVEFGHAVALDGDTLAIGCPRKSAGAGLAGAVYVFVRSGATWMQQAKLTSALSAFGQFGQDVALDGDTLVVGAYKTTSAVSGASGVAHVFVRAGGVWTEQAVIDCPDHENGVDFGWSVDVDGDVALIGAPKMHVLPVLFSGAAYVFARAGGVWTHVQRLSASDAAQGDEFGYDVALDGGTALAGARGANHPGLAGGSVYVFVESGGVWSQQARLDAPLGASTPGEFGTSVALGGDWALAGDPRYSLSTIGWEGSAFAFRRTAATWTQVFHVVPTGLQWGERFGWSVGLSGDTLLGGAQLDGDGGLNAGSTTFFRVLDCATVAASEVVRLGDPPNPAAFLPGLTSGPLAGGTWDPKISYAGFVVNPERDFLLVSLFPANFPTSLGTLLADPAGQVLFAQQPSSVDPFHVQIPGSCALLGLALTAQAASVDAEGVHLTNALDIVLGSI